MAKITLSAFVEIKLISSCQAVAGGRALQLRGRTSAS
jgi:hypothetical protein